MRKLVAALSLSLALCAAPARAENTIGPTNQVLCSQLATQASSIASLQTLVAGVTGKTIFICGWHVTSSAATVSTFQLSYGTGTNCGTTNTNITPAYNIINTAPSTDHVSIATLNIPVGTNLCIISSTTSLQIGVWYGQY